jgi:hypothetical protein
MLEMTLTSLTFTDIILVGKKGSTTFSYMDHPYLMGPDMGT